MGRTECKVGPGGGVVNAKRAFAGSSVPPAGAARVRPIGRCEGYYGIFTRLEHDRNTGPR